MAFDPSTVDLSFVEPALRAEVLRRITVLQRFIDSRGRAAERIACEEIGISRHQLHVLARAWSARRRAEDVTLRATKRRKPSTLAPDVIEIIANAADDMSGATVREIEIEVAARASNAGLPPPSYPTVNKYVRERANVRVAETMEDLDADIVIDVIVSDIPVTNDDGARIRPHVVVLLERESADWPAVIAITTGQVGPCELSDVIVQALNASAVATEGPVWVPAPVRVSIPAGMLSDAEVDALSFDRLSVIPRSGDVSVPGRIATAALGTSLAGYKLRPKLVGSLAATRTSGSPAPATIA